ncbi:methionine ABC transporter permease [Yinghuangia seranimata]|uniref:methionine ABC transporter permease n=1 Tax=Yinghuangia seranimata TaxID=408067 RepID=UPI00248B92D6|nr:methionine ABC transporter permease [Yinghuangia seranimata]MDI2126696.1 methionine ABC transporter permease [Yinghuangia seranimata]
MPWDELRPLLWTATQETFSMVGWTMLFTVAVGLPIGVLLVLTDKGGLLNARFGAASPVTALNRVLGLVVNVGRSFPFLILLVALIPFTRWVMGLFGQATAIGTDAMVVPLTVAAIPFFARLVETSVREVDRGLVEAAQAMGASVPTVVRKVLVREALPSLVAGLTTTTIAVIGYSAMAGVIGAGGLGDLAIRYGYKNFDDRTMTVTVVLLIVIVQAVQFTGGFVSRRLNHR